MAEQNNPNNDAPRDNGFPETGVGAQRESAVMLGVLSRGDLRRAVSDPLEELASLAKTARIEIKGQVVQKLDKPNASTFAGTGTVEKVAEMARELGADTIICDNDLSPAQLRNLERICERKVVDRTDLILDIFARHAKTLQARLQVELAQLEYTRPRLRKMWSHLTGEQGGVGFRGPGEKQLEMDKRMIGKRIKELKARLSDIRKRKEREVSSRRDIHTVALVGYTNAGKSTLFGRLTQSEPYIADELFATLDTKTRPFQVKHRVRAVVSDTVGFIDHLPHRLVESFHATLEEVLQADLLVHVVDVSREEPMQQVLSVNDVLEKIGCTDRPTITALNKVDQTDPALIPYFQKRLTRAIAISAKSGQGVDDLKEAIAEALTANDRPCRVSAPFSDGRFIAALEARASELSQRVHEERLILDLVISPGFLDQALRITDDRSKIHFKWLD